VRIAAGCVIGVLIVSNTVVAATSVPEPKPAEADMLVGAYYFPGWSQEDRWFCVRANDKAIHPLLGWYREGDPEVANWQIKQAVEHGVSFFAFDYYSFRGSEMLENAIEAFMRADYADRFRFCINWCNHSAAETQDAEELDRFADVVVDKYLTHPSYLRIGDRPVLMILSGYSFVMTLGVERARAAFDRLEQRCKGAGLPGLYLVFCEGEIRSEQAVKDSFAAGADAFCLYNYPYAGTDFTGPGRGGEATYEHMTAQGEALWKHWKGITGGRFWPTVMPGWDRRPWTKDQDLVRTGSTPDLFERSLRLARDHVNADRVVMMEAWNEWGEGSVLEPSVEWGCAYLDKVRDVFCPDAGPHEDVDPRSLGVPLPVFACELPAEHEWRFNFGVEGWTKANASELGSTWGALTTVSENGDPQLTSPLTYLRCEDYGRLRVRMRLTPKAGEAPGTATGQLFWSTTERGLCEELSVHFAVEVDGGWHEYAIDLSASPAWAGLTDRLRFDPVDVAGVTVEIDLIELVP